jgi:hypothetical protein
MRLQAGPALSSFAVVLSLLAGCGSGPKAGGREVALGERFKLSRDEKVWVKDTSLTAELKGVRRTWYVDGKSETAEADIIITLDGKEQRQWMGSGEKVTAGEYVLQLAGANPFGKTDCELVVTRR